MAEGVNGSSAPGANDGVLTGVRVVECGEGVSAAFAAKMMADLGAEVIKVEHPGGDLARRRGPFRDDLPDPDASGLYLFLNANKKGITLDLTRTEGRELLDGLLAKADILVHNVPPRERAGQHLESDRFHARFPSLIVSTISPFGDSGPRKDWKAYEMNLAHAGGWAYLSPGASSHPELPPLKAFGQQTHFQGGVHCFYVTLGAYWQRMATGEGQVLDVSEQECIAAMLEMNFMHYSYAGRETSRLGRRGVGPWAIFDCSDGQIFVICVEEDQWQRLVELMDNPEWAGEELFKDRVLRGQNQDALIALMSEWMAGWKVNDLYHKGQAARIAFAPVNTMEDLYSNEQLRTRDFFVPLKHPKLGIIEMPGAPDKYGAGGWSLRTLAPHLGQHNEEVFSGRLGISRERLAVLKQLKIV